MKDGLQIDKLYAELSQGFEFHQHLKNTHPLQINAILSKMRNHEDMSADEKQIIESTWDWVAFSAIDLNFFRGWDGNIGGFKYQIRSSDGLFWAEAPGYTRIGYFKSLAEIEAYIQWAYAYPLRDYQFQKQLRANKRRRK